MPEPRTFYRKVIRFEILSEEPFDDYTSLEDIAYQVAGGYYSGMFLDDEVYEPVDGPKMAELLIAQGSEPGFFQLDDEGNSLEETDEED